jgi:hypothetical protein
MTGTQPLLLRDHFAAGKSCEGLQAVRQTRQQKYACASARWQANKQHTALQ